MNWKFFVIICLLTKLDHSLKKIITFKISSMIKLIKEFRPAGNYDRACVQIRGNAYSCKFDNIKNMVDELKKDFPELTDGDISVQKYGGQRIRGISFVEAYLPKETKMPDGYEEIRETESIL